MATLATLSLVIPTFTTTTPGPVFSPAQLAFAAITSLALYGLFVTLQTGRHRDYFLQVTDARPDTGGLSGATPAEAVSWGKIDPDQLPDAVVCYLDSTVALPIITAYALAKHKPRKPRRLYDRREEFMQLLLTEYKKSSRR